MSNALSRKVEAEDGHAARPQPAHFCRSIGRRLHGPFRGITAIHSGALDVKCSTSASAQVTAKWGADADPYGGKVSLQATKAQGGEQALYL